MAHRDRKSLCHSKFATHGKFAGAWCSFVWRGLWARGQAPSHRPSTVSHKVWKQKRVNFQRAFSCEPFKGFIGHRPSRPHPRICLAFSSSRVDSASVRHRFDIDFLIWPRRIRGWGLEGLCPINPSQCEPHREGEKTYLCPNTDRVRFRLVPSRVWTGREYGLDWFQVRFCYPLGGELVGEPHAKQYWDSALNRAQHINFGSSHPPRKIIPKCPFGIPIPPQNQFPGIPWIGLLWAFLSSLIENRAKLPGIFRHFSGNFFSGSRIAFLGEDEVDMLGSGDRFSSFPRKQSICEAQIFAGNRRCLQEPAETADWRLSP